MNPRFLPSPGRNCNRPFEIRVVSRNNGLWCAPCGVHRIVRRSSRDGHDMGRLSQQWFAVVLARINSEL